MKDIEVGELWRKIAQFEELSKGHLAATGCTVHAITVNLTRKLVEERAAYYDLTTGHGPDHKQALRDFGIDPESWK